MTSPRETQKTFVRVRSACERELGLMLRQLPPELAEKVRGIPVRLDDWPPDEQTAGGATSELLSQYDRDTGEITVYVMSIFDMHGKRPGEFTAEFRRRVVEEWAEAIGEDFDWLIGDG